ncbi:MAG: hypothetical protein QXV35_02940 [Archaeoglobaceae archaeon]
MEKEIIKILDKIEEDVNEINEALISMKTGIKRINLLFLLLMALVTFLILMFMRW